MVPAADRELLLGLIWGCAVKPFITFDVLKQFRFLVYSYPNDSITLFVKRACNILLIPSSVNELS